MYGSAHQVIPAAAAETWIATLLAADWSRVEPAAFAAALIARRTGDRERDLSPPVRERVSERLRANRSPQAWVRMVLEVVTLEVMDQKRLLGDSLPPGLRLME